MKAFETHFQINLIDHYENRNSIHPMMAEVFPKNWDELNFAELNRFTTIAAKEWLFSGHQFQYVQWKPCDSIEEFHETISKGPLLVYGSLGLQVYPSQAPRPLDHKIGKIPVFGWLAKDEKGDVNLNGFAVIVGVNVSKGVVFFIDPSDPNNRTMATSYAKLQEKIFDRWNTPGVESTSSEFAVAYTAAT